MSVRVQPGEIATAVIPKLSNHSPELRISIFSAAALNMLMRSSGEWLESFGITAVAISPGWTRTDMGGPNASNSIEQASVGVYQVITGISSKDAGKFLNFDGTTLPW